MSDKFGKNIPGSDVTVDGIYNANFNKDPSTIGIIASERNTDSENSNQTKRITAKTGDVDTDIVALDVSIHDSDGNNFSPDTPLITETAIRDGVDPSIKATVTSDNELKVFDETTHTNISSFATTNHSDLLSIESKQDIGNASLSSIDSKVSTATKQDTGNTSLSSIDGKLTTTNTQIGALTETVPATDTASSGLNGRLQRIAQRLTSLLSFFNADFGASSGGIRTNAQVGNSTGSADFNSGTTSAQTLRTSSNLSDGNANKITSTLINSKQRLDFNSASEGIDGNTVPFQTIQVGGTDGTNLQTLSTDIAGRLKLAGFNYFHPIFNLRVQAVSSATGSLATSLVIPISSTSSGNLIVVSVSSSVAGTVTVTDNLSQVYTTAISGTSGAHTNYIFYKANTTSGVTSITVNSTSSSGICSIVTEYFSISTVPLDKTSTGTVTGTSSFSSSSTATITSTPQLLIGSAHGATKNNQTYTAGSGWSSVGTVNGFNAGAGQLYVEDQYAGSLTTYAATGTASGNDTIIADIATFVTTNTNLIVSNQPKLVKSGAGILKRVIVNSVGIGSPSLTLYDNITNSGTIIAVISLLNPGSLTYDLNFTTGLTIVANTNTGDYTLVYD